MNRTASRPLGVFFYLYLKKNTSLKKAVPYNAERVDFGILFMNSSNKVPRSLVFFCRNYGCARRWGFHCVSMKSVIHTLNVTSMTAHKPNDFFKRLKFGTLFSLRVHFSHRTESCSETCAHGSSRRPGGSDAGASTQEPVAQA